MATQYGDTSGSLSGHEIGRDQIIEGDAADNLLFGDARSILDYARVSDLPRSSKIGERFAESASFAHQPGTKLKR